MRPGIKPDKRQRLASAAGVAAFHALLGYALVIGLGFDGPSKTSEALKLFDIAPEPPPPPAKPPPPPAPAQAKAAAAPPAPKAEAAPVVAPTPEVRLAVQSRFATASTPGTGSDSSQGASNGPGSGTGGGGSGTGQSSGGAITRARQVAGALTGRDYPRAAKRARAGGTVLVRYTVGVDGHPSGCTITQSSGNAALDAVTCRLIEQRFRYEPARDAEGRPVLDVQTGRHIWWTEPKRRPLPYEWTPEEAPID